MNRFQEDHKVMNEIVTISSAGGATSLPYSFHDCDEICFIVGIGGTAAAASTTINPTLNVIMGENSPLSTNTTVANATGLMGCSTANQLSNLKSALITITTASTLNETVAINGYTLTYVGQSTSVSTVATSLAFGSSVGSTNAGGLDAVTNSLASVINASTLSGSLSAATVSTAAVRVWANDTASTDVNVVSTGGGLVPSIDRAQSIISVKAEDLDSTSNYVALTISSAATTVNCAITVIKKTNRYNPPFQPAQTNIETT